MENPYLISFMDHSPGQGQYRNLEIYRKHLPDAGTNITDEEFGELIHRELSKDSLSFEQLKALADLAREKGISVASHDDDSLEKLEVNEKFGVKISEFPVISFGCGTFMTFSIVGAISARQPVSLSVHG